MTRPDVEDLTWPLAGLLSEPPGTWRDLPVEAVYLDLGGELVQDQALHGLVRVARTNRGVLVRARLATSLAESCSRCLRPTSTALDLTIEEEVLPSLELSSGLAVDRTAEPDAARLSDHHELELEPLVREAIWLAEPIAPLCRPDCPGLCPTCGGDLGEGAHDHEEGPLDPRLEALRLFHLAEDDRAERGPGGA